MSKVRRPAVMPRERVGTIELPLNQPEEPSAVASGIQQARIYVVAEKEADKSPDMIASKTHINVKLAY